MTSYDDIGGAPSVAAVVEQFYARVLQDPGLAPFFAGVDLDRLKGHQRKFIGAAVGGPEVYEGRSMAEAHAGLGVTEEAFGKVVSYLIEALFDYLVERGHPPPGDHRLPGLFANGWSEG